MNYYTIVDDNGVLWSTHLFTKEEADEIINRNTLLKAVRMDRYNANG